MQGLIEFPNDFGSHSCEVKNGIYLPFIDPLEAKGVSVSCYNPFRKNIITCKDQYKDEFITEVNGLALNLKLSTDIITSQSYIPVLDLASAQNGAIPESCPIVGVSLCDVLQRSPVLTAGKYREVNNIDFRKSLLLKDNLISKKVILFLTGPDTLIEWIWYNRDECKLFKTIKEMGIWAVSGFNFSLIDGECPFSHALNLKRSLFSSYLAEQAGLLSIPHVYCLNDYHIRRWIEWFKLNPNLKFFTMNCQLQKSEKDINQIVIAIKNILIEIPYLHVLLQGFHLNKLGRLDHFLDRIHLADKIAAKYAQNHRRIFFDFEKQKLNDEYADKMNLAELLHPNILMRYSFIERAAISASGKSDFYLS